MVPFLPMMRWQGMTMARGFLPGVAAGGADGTGFAGAAGELAVADGFAMGDAGDLLPDALLEIGAVEVERDGEVGALAGEEFVELPGGFAEDGMFGLELPVFLDDRCAAWGGRNGGPVSLVSLATSMSSPFGEGDGGVGGHNFFSRPDQR